MGNTESAPDYSTNASAKDNMASSKIPNNLFQASAGHADYDPDGSVPVPQSMKEVPIPPRAEEDVTEDNDPNSNNPHPLPPKTPASSPTSFGANQNPTNKHRRDESELSQHPFGGSKFQRGISDLPVSCRSKDSFRVGRFQAEEHNVRRLARHNRVWLAAINGYSAVLIFFGHLISIESVLSIALSVGLTCYTYYTVVRKHAKVMYFWFASTTISQFSDCFASFHAFVDRRKTTQALMDPLWTMYYYRLLSLRP